VSYAAFGRKRLLPCVADDARRGEVGDDQPVAAGRRMIGEPRATLVGG
jgi:hypothetical protein